MAVSKILPVLRAFKLSRNSVAGGSSSPSGMTELNGLQGRQTKQGLVLGMC